MVFELDNSKLSYNILLMDTEIHKDDGLIEAVECLARCTNANVLLKSTPGNTSFSLLEIIENDNS